MAIIVAMPFVLETKISEVAAGGSTQTINREGSKPKRKKARLNPNLYAGFAKSRGA